MKKMKRIVSLLTAAAMTLSLSSIALSAAEETTQAGSAIGEGETDWFVLQDKVVVTLPTSANLDFTFDPQGLANLDATGMDLDAFLALKGFGTAGIVFGAGSELRFINNSNIAVDVGVELAISGDASVITELGAENATLLDDGDPGDPDADTPVPATPPANNILIYAIPSSSNLKYNAPSTLDAPGDLSQVYTSSGIGYAVDPANTDLDFKLGAADYTIAMPEEAVNASGITLTAQPGTGNGQALKLKGYINPLADWSSYVPADSETPAEDSVSITATWSVAKATAPEIATADVVTGAPNLVKPTATPAEVEAAEGTSEPTVAVSGWGDDADSDKVKDAAITYDAATVNAADLDLGFNVAAGITAGDITVKLAADLTDAPAIATESLTITGSKLYIDKDYVFPAAGPLDLSITIGENTWSSDVTVTEIPIANGWAGTTALINTATISYEVDTVADADLDLGFNVAEGLDETDFEVKLGADLSSAIALTSSEIVVTGNKLYIDQAYDFPTEGGTIDLSITYDGTTWTSEVAVTPTAVVVIANGWDGLATAANGTPIVYSKAALGANKLDLGFNVANDLDADDITITLQRQGGSPVTITATTNYVVEGNKLYYTNSFAASCGVGDRTITITIGANSWTGTVTTQT
jgi:hypothetical protein